MEWLINGNHILVIYYEELTEGNLKPALEKIIQFMNFTTHKERLDCVSKHRKGNFYQHAKCIPNAKKDDQQNNKYVYSAKHVRWVNSAIRRVNNEIKRRGFDDSYLNSYENNNFPLTYCS